MRTGICETCGVAIRRDPTRGDMAYLKRRFCSRRCARLGSGRHVEPRFCEHCGETIPKGRETPATYARRRYCSQACHTLAVAAQPYQWATEEARERAVALAEDVAELLGYGEVPERIARRLGRSVGAIDITMRRAGRQDLARPFQRALRVAS